MPIREITGESVRNLPRSIQFAATMSAHYTDDGEIEIHQSYSRDPVCTILEASGGDKIEKYFKVVLDEGLVSQPIGMPDVRGGSMGLLAVGVKKRVTIRTSVGMQSYNTEERPLVLFVVINEHDISSIIDHVHKIENDSANQMLDSIVEFIRENGPFDSHDNPIG